MQVLTLARGSSIHNDTYVVLFANRPRQRRLVPSERADEVLQSIAANVRQWRERRGLTQAALAERADMDLRAIQRIEQGKINFGVVGLVHVAAALDVSPSLLLETAQNAPRMPGRPPKASHGSC